MREMRTTVPDPGADIPNRSGLGVQRWTPCGPAWGHSGYVVYTSISADTRHETVLAVNGDAQLLGATGMEQLQNLLAQAFCRR